MPKRFLVDAHLDLSTNAIALNRDLTQPVHAIRANEIRLGWTDTPDRGKGTVALPELRAGNIGLVFATMIARVTEPGWPTHATRLPGWHSPQQAYADAQAQRCWYEQMEALGEMVPIRTQADLKRHLALWQGETDSASKKPIGYILALEGADSIVSVEYLHRYYEQGLRSIGISHFGPGRYAAGTHSDGSGLTRLGVELLTEMNRLPMLLDLTHLTDKGFFEALDVFSGAVIASHQNCRRIIPGERQFSDEQLKRIIERGGVIGGALDAWMLYPNYRQAQQTPQALGINLEKLVDHFDHICQLAGSSDHIGFGSDLDGLFGTEQSPYDLDTIADLQQFDTILQRRGYSDEDLDKIFHKNWVNLLSRVLV